VQPGNHLLLNNLNIVESKKLLSQQSKERYITGAGLAQAGKSYRAVRTVEFNC
jgi:hypothetical protein